MYVYMCVCVCVNTIKVSVIHNKVAFVKLLIHVHCNLRVCNLYQYPTNQQTVIRSICSAHNSPHTSQQSHYSYVCK